VGQEIARAYPLAAELLALAQQTDNSDYLIAAHNARGITLFYRGAFTQALVQFESASSLYDPQRHPTLAYRYGQDPGVICHTFAALTLWMLGYPAQAIRRSQDALTLAQDPFSLAYALFWTSLPLQCCRQSHTVQDRAETAITLSQEQGFAVWLAGGMILQGWTCAQHGQVEAGLAQMQPWIEHWRTTGAKRPLPYLLSLLGEAYATHGQMQEALAILAAALSEVETYGECWWEAELHRLKGELLLAHPPRQEAEAETCLLRALDIASHQGAKSLELRAAISLCHLWRARAQHDRARALLAPLYAWFTEGLETVDLIEAKALLDALP
jgi:predicted ATPase